MTHAHPTVSRNVSGPRSRNVLGLIRKQLTLFSYALVMGPMAALLHELGHWTVGKAVGFQPILHASAVSGVPEEAPFGGKPLGVALVALAGPAVTFIITTVGYVLWRRRSSRTWALALAFATPVRFVLNLLFFVGSVLVALGIAERGKQNFDEMIASLALGVPVEPVVGIGAVALPLAWSLIIRRLDEDRWTSVGSLLAGTAIGMALWLGPIGRSLLP